MVGRSVLNSRLFQYFGDISYSLYLWHWPLIVFYSEVTRRAIGPRSGLVLFLASVLLAHLSKIFVEDPFRGARYAIGRTLAFGAGGIALAVIAGTIYLAREMGDTRTGYRCGSSARSFSDEGSRLRLAQRRSFENHSKAGEGER